ncbi:hypothetical protein [Modestobacter roseus]|uniref:DUF8129 domain-containing protein n=1 Tax=Modestobacter roseus TaxID=1181884 RepID=A0A562IML0_9ACTN|nr:hypothetical protein [Modestobacter roseus]MQA32483.1 hypothetical protein [Modestobacter roseus]TWH72251.1 hypothetical protein JD78_00762 [Modestobacter roseus]
MTDRDALPVPDYDHLPVGSLTSRIRTLDAEQLETVLGYERAHANRVQVVQAMDHRLAELRSGAQPSGGDPEGTQPEHAPAPAGGSPVSEATTGPVVNPPSQGDPTNPAQPRSTG